MPAPRLLDKKLISVSLATERKQEIDKGIKLTESIEALREAKIKEGQDLEEFRVNTLKAIQIEIDRKSVENEKFTAINKALKEERVRLESPIDLTEKWNLVNGEEEKNQQRDERLSFAENLFLERERKIEEKDSVVSRRETEVSRTEEEAQKTLLEAEIKNQEAQDLKEEAAQTLSRAIHSAGQIETESKEREKELEERELNLIQREEDVHLEKTDIINQRKFLADQRQTLERGFEELRRKQNG